MFKEYSIQRASEEVLPLLKFCYKTSVIKRENKNT